MRHYGVEGVSIAVIRDSKLEWAKGYGLADIETKQAVTTATLFQAASISKPVAAMGALVLVQDGKLSLDRRHQQGPEGLEGSRPTPTPARRR